MEAGPVEWRVESDRRAGEVPGPTQLRAHWVSALEEALVLDDPHQFMRWMERHVRPVLGYEMAICATGWFEPQHVAADRLLVRGFPQRYLDSLRDASGVISLPRARARTRSSLRALEAGPLSADLGVLLALDEADSASRHGSYFLFGRVRALPDARQHYLGEMMAPHMRAALARSLAAEPELHPRFTAQVALTRREHELLHWLVAGRTTGEIARSSFRSTHTVNNQVRAILRKLGASNRTEAIALALGLGLVPPLERQPQTRVMAAQQRAVYLVSRPARAVRVAARTRRTAPSLIVRLDSESSSGCDH